ncbi:MAG: sensor histidine kinase, partial [Clostridia bacterium]|nr:sensor histidine kinase [Clostridia bacterium]
NAIKFSSEGGRLRISISNVKERRVQIEVFNEGEGIPQEELPLVFERFYKTDKSRNLDKNGVGLGLFISKTIITAHGEKIWAESEQGQNCRFLFTLQRPLF